MRDSIERVIMETLEECPKPRLSAGFASSVINQIGNKAERKLSRKATFILMAYGIAAGLGTIAILSGTEWPPWMNYAAAVLTPVFFAATAAPRAFFRATGRLISLFQD